MARENPPLAPGRANSSALGFDTSASAKRRRRGLSSGAWHPWRSIRSASRSASARPAQAAGVAAASVDAIGQLAIRHDLALPRAEMRGGMASLRQDVDGSRRETRADLAQPELRRTAWLGTMMAGAVALAAALARLL